jgi:ribosomal protein S18 acetylase RimI-like enzyme
VRSGSQLETTFTIQCASWRDLNGLRQLEQECFPKDAWPLWDLIAVLTFPDVVRLKATVADKLAGFIAGDIRRSENMGWVTTVGVLEEFRKQGIGTALLDACEEQMGMNRIRLCVRRSNTGAIQLYYQRGYFQVSIWTAYYHDGEDALVLEKRRGISTILKDSNLPEM